MLDIKIQKIRETQYYQNTHMGQRTQGQTYL